MFLLHQDILGFSLEGRVAVLGVEVDLRLVPRVPKGDARRVEGVVGDGAVVDLAIRVTFRQDVDDPEIRVTRFSTFIPRFFTNSTKFGNENH